MMQKEDARSEANDRTYPSVMRSLTIFFSSE